MTTKKTKTEGELNKEIKQQTEVYTKVVEKKPAAEADKEAEKLWELKTQLRETLAEGADVCPTCGQKPSGMHKNPGTYEVGCVNCPPYHRGQGKAREYISYSARADNREEAVEKWNTGDWESRPDPETTLKP